MGRAAQVLLAACLAGRSHRRGGIAAGVLLSGAIGLVPATMARAADPPPASLPTALSLEQVLQEGLGVSTRLERAQRAVARDAAVTGLSRSLINPRLNLIGSASYTQVGSSFGLITNLPTFGDISFAIGDNGYAVLRNSFANAGMVLDVDLLPLRQLALISASQAMQRGSVASLRESERQARFELVSTYRQLQLSQALVPVWRSALEASSALLADVRAFRRRGLAARIDTLRAEALQAFDRQGLSDVEAQLASQQARLAILMRREGQPALTAIDPIVEQPAWPQDLPSTLDQALRQRPLLEAFRFRQQAQRQQARAARAGLLPSVGLVAGIGYSGDRLSVPVLQQTGSLQGPVNATLPSFEQNGSISGSFYNWGAALLVRQPLWDGGQSGRTAAVAEREAELIATDEQIARQQISQDVSSAWNALAASPQAIRAAMAAVRAQERALQDARLRYRAQIDPLTDVLLIQRDLQAARASLVTQLTRQALDHAVLERETGQAAAAKREGGG